MKRVLCYTITRAASQPRLKLLLDTITYGVDQAGQKMDWIVFANGPGAVDITHGALKAGLISRQILCDVNRGQHLPTNEAVDMALEGDYDHLVRIDEDVEFETKRWLAKLIEASEALDNRAIIAPHVRGLKYPVRTSEDAFYLSNGTPCKLAFDALGGICRLHPVALLKEFEYHADTRQPMGFGDATGIARWAQTHMIPLVVVQTVRVKHAKTTKGQEVEDGEHFRTHSLFQRCPYIPTWRPYDQGDAV